MYSAKIMQVILYEESESFMLGSQPQEARKRQERKVKPMRSSTTQENVCELLSCPVVS
jgi:hypothetical protein